MTLFCSSSFAQTDPRDSDSPFGVLAFLSWDHPWNRHHFGGDNPEKAVALMKEAGVRFVRMDFLWADIEPRPKEFQFEKYDRLVNLLTENDIKIVGLLNYNASWSPRAWNHAPTPEIYVRYASAVVRRYKDRVKYWEIWNEPDSPTYWKPQDDMKSYTRLLRRVYPALKAEDPTCRVLLGGLSAMHSMRLKQVYRHGGKDYFDIVNIHPFVDPLLPNAVPTLKGAYTGVYKVMWLYKDEDKEIWFTELGCPGVEKPGQANGWWLGESPTEEQQAQWVERVYRFPLEWKGVKKVFWAFFRDTPDHFRNGVDSFGLVREDFSKKPAFYAYKKKATGS